MWDIMRRISIVYNVCWRSSHHFYQRRLYPETQLFTAAISRLIHFVVRALDR